jgi:putative ABC transport system permease protein
VGDVAFTGELDDPKARFQVYRPLGQQPLGAPTIALRTRGEPAAAAADLRRAVAELDPELPVYEPLSARGRSERYLRNHALTGWVMFGLAGLGLLLAALGVYGLFAGFVAERRREIGVRLALGARSAQVLGLVLGKGLRLALLGTLLGAAGALAAMPVLRAVAHQLPAHEPLAVVVLAAALVAVALFACWLPARRAAAVDPMVALRHD